MRYLVLLRSVALGAGQDANDAGVSVARRGVERGVTVLQT